MSELIEELKQEHLEILATLNKANEIGISAAEVQTILLSAEASLLSHLRKEDEQFYPVLRKEAENSKELRNTLDLFAMDMENVTRSAQEFFYKYSEGVLGKDFVGDFEKLFIAIGTRIKNEEEVLYDEYEMIINDT